MFKDILSDQKSQSQKIGENGCKMMEKFIFEGGLILIHKKSDVFQKFMDQCI